MAIMRQHGPGGSELIEFRLTGPDMRPGTVRAGELADILRSVEDMIAAVVSAEHPGLSKEDIVIGLVSIGEGSVQLQFSSQVPEVVLPAYSRVAAAVVARDFGSLPNAAIAALQEVTSFIKQRNGVAELIRRNGQEIVLATVTPDLEFSTRSPLTGETTIYGYVVRVGGRVPKAMVQLANGRTVYCDVDRTVARQLGLRLYTWVGLEGVARWDAETLELEDFRINGLAVFDGTPVSEAVAQLAELIGRYYHGITDVEGYISDLRGEDGED